MKLPTHSSIRNRRRGMALVVVLAMLVLLTGLVVAFFSTVTSDAGSSAVYSNDTRAKQLAESAVNLVMGQIVEATKGFKTSNATPDYSQPLAWASQPGAIRTFDTSGATPYRIFKLYSAQSLVENGTQNLSADVPATWATDTAYFTDLNAPVSDEGGNPVYPIMDPHAQNAVEGFTITGAAPTIGTTNTAPMPARWVYMLKDGTLTSPTGTIGTTATWTGAPANLTPSSTNPIVGRISFWTDDETCKVNINTASEGTYWDIPRWNSTQDQSYANNQPVQKEFQRYPGHPAMTSLAPVFFASNSTSTPVLSKAQRDAIYSVAPRVVGGGSDAGTVGVATLTGALTPDPDRLYASVDELMFKTDRTSQDSNASITADMVRQRAFFLTASSRAPETTMFNTPRVSMWPHTITSTTITGNRTTSYDRLIAFCGSVGRNSSHVPYPYYFQRADSQSPTYDWTNIQRNRELLRWLRTLSNQTAPGFGASLVSKTTSADRDHLLVEMLDYIRSTNTFDDNVSPATYTTQAGAEKAPQFTAGRTSLNQNFIGHAAVAPIRVPAGLTDGTTSDSSTLMGFGRFHTISEACLQFICTADGRSGTFQAPAHGAGAPNLTQLLQLASNVAPGTSSANRTYGYNLQVPSPLANGFFTPTVGAAANTVFPINNTLGNNTPLSTAEKRIQMMLYFDFIVPGTGWEPYCPDGSMDVEITGDFSLGGQAIAMTGTQTVNFSANGVWQNWTGLGGNMGFRWLFSPYSAINGFGTTSLRVPIARGLVPADTDTNPAASWPLHQYALVSVPVTVPANATMSFSGPTKLLVKFYSRQLNTGRAVARSASDLVQTIELNFPAATFPTPDLADQGTSSTTTVTSLPQNWWVFRYGSGFFPAPSALLQSGGSVSVDKGRFQLLPNPGTVALGAARINDTLRTLVPYHSDTRLVAGSHYVPDGVFQPSTFYYDTTRSTVSPFNQIACYINVSNGQGSGTDAGNAFYMPPKSDQLVKNANYSGQRFPKFSGFVPSSGGGNIPSTQYQQFGDFDNGIAWGSDGPFINKPDEGNISLGLSGTATPYFGGTDTPGGPTFFSPNRQIPSAGMFGSLPTRMSTGNIAYPPAANNNAWRTLLLRPQAGHPGAANPPDHLWTDLFWMPVVEPYAISEPLSTAGKTNLNYSIAPFNYINRKTGMAALLRSEKTPAFPISSGNIFKTNGIQTFTTRYEIDTNETLKQWDAKFAGNNLFVTPSQICEMHLIPTGQTINLTGTTTNADSVMSAFWATNALTGDNSRERPYTNLLGRITTKSNSYTVHYRVQVLKKVPSTPVDQWVEGRDLVLSESRGSTLIERYVDPNDPRLPDFATETDPAKLNIDNYYRFRVVQSRKFAP